jgi:5-methylcytosine-specific restriction enzyme A
MRARTVCAEPGCPAPAVYRGRCGAHRWRPNTRVLRRIAAQVRERAGHRCEQCGRPVAPGTGAVDHRIPLAEGGPTTLANLQLLCPACDRLKTRADRARIRRRLRTRGQPLKRAEARLVVPSSIFVALLSALHAADLFARSLFAVVPSAIRLLALSTEKVAESHAAHDIAGRLQTN